MRMRARAACAWIAVGFAACGPGGKGTHPNDDAGPGSADAAVPTPDAFDGPWSDFPVDPIIDPGGAPATSGTLFGDPAGGAQTGGPCLIEPEIGTLFPRNWLRPRFSWVPTGSENLYELRLTAGNEANPLVVYTNKTTWTMPAVMWSALSSHIQDAPITVTVRGATLTGQTLSSGPEKGSAGDIAIAPADAPGTIVYWTTSNGTALRGFQIGDENVRDVMRPTNSSSQCIGCHSSTPDGTYIGFSSSQDPGNGDPTTLGLLAGDGTFAAPPFVTASARTLMSRVNQEMPTFTSMHWKDGDHVALTMFPTGATPKFEITWTDLEATSTGQGTGWGVLARGGDTNPAAYASFAHTVDAILYVSSSFVRSGVTVTHGNLMTVPYNNRAGGTATPIAGAATTQYNEYYPTFSPDDRLIAFNRITDGLESYNDRAQAELFIIPPAGGTPQRLAANDPTTCSGRTSPGITNSWPKWAPAVTSTGNKRYYWLTFSSTRGPASRPQLYITAVVDDGVTRRTYPALYLWNQPATESNHTPAWDIFDIPVN
jgi:hypothetical protein